MAAAPGAVQDLEIILLPGKGARFLVAPRSYSLQEGEKTTVTFIPFQSPTDLPKTEAERHWQQTLLNSRKEAASSEPEFLTFVL